MSCRFVWSDLASFSVEEAQRFYQHCLGWQFQQAEWAGPAVQDNPNQGDYILCLKDGVAVAGLYAMPARFVQRKMPSFWMSYIAVSDLDACLHQVEAYGGKVELGPEASAHGGRIALVRDPAGAGVTCWESDSRAASSVEHVLYVSDASQVADFYTEIFGWEWREQPIAWAEGRADWGHYELIDKAAGGERVARVWQIPNAIKGDKEYWGLHFALDAHDDLTTCLARVREAGGALVAQDETGVLLRDSQGAVFLLR